MNRIKTAKMAGTAVLVAVPFVGLFAAAPLNVTDASFVTYSTNVTKLVAAAVAADDGLPAAAGTPAFHLDVTRTNETGRAWTFDGANVTRIPSLTGDRYLTADLTDATWTGWNGTPASDAPTFAEDADLGMKVLDFGAVGSRQVLVFDQGTESENVLKTVGTVFAVLKNRGGWLMGGAAKTSTTSYLYAWHRGYSYSTEQSPAKLDAPIADNNSNGNLQQAVVWLNGERVKPMKCGFSGRWDLLTLRPKAAMSAIGLGVGDARANYPSRSGGSAFAELIVYSETLSDELCGRVEAYLAKKWFGESKKGYASRAAAGEVRVACTREISDVPQNRGFTGMTAGAEVPSGQTLEIGRIRGGWAITNSFEKTGAGTLAVGDASALGGKVILSEGVLSFVRRPIPASIAAGYAMRFDASVDGACTTVAENGTNYVTAWRNEVGDTWYNQVYTAQAENAARRPVFVANAVNGMPAVDFGRYGASGRTLALMTNDAPVSVSGVSTCLAVLSPNGGGGHLLGDDSIFKRAATPSSFWSAFHAQDDYWKAWVNGLKIDYTLNGYAAPEFQVIAFHAGFGSLARIGGAGTDLGGAKICEIVLYKTPLSERQMEDAQAYLAWKWLGRILPGYVAPAAPARARADIGDLTVTGGALDVPAGATVSVRTLTADRLVKTGGGTLRLPKGQAFDSLSVAGGAVETVDAPDVSSASELASDPVFHVAADEAASLETETVGGVEYVDYWHDLSVEQNTAWNATNRTANASRPWVDRTTLLNGKPTVEFGPVKTGGATLILARSIDNARAVYIVYKANNTKNYAVLGPAGTLSLDSGTACRSYHIDFLGGDNSTLFYGAHSQQVANGDIYMDGQKVEASTVIGTSDFHLVECHTLGGAHIGAIARDRWDTRHGGVNVAEILVYDRPLSARERVATRNKLLAKWFPAVAQQELPDPVVAGTSGIRDLVFTGGGWTSDEDTKVLRLTGMVDGTAVKDGAGTLDIASATAFTGTVSVAAGVLKLSGTVAEEAATPVQENRVLHLDAAANVATDADGRVTSWSSKVGTLKVMPYKAGSLTGSAVLEKNTDVYNQPSVRIAQYTALRLADADGNWTALEGAKSIFWVIGSQEGGGFVLAGTNTTYSFHRQYSNDDDFIVGTSITRAILAGLAGGDLANTSRALWRLNGTDINALKAYFSGGWDVLSLNLKDASCTIPAIGGLAADARVYATGYENANRAGNQRLCELIVYDRVLTDAEVRRNEAYLNARWGVNPVRTARANGLSVDLAGGSLDCAGTSQYVAGLSGSGSVTDGDLAIGKTWTITFTETGAEVVSAAGTLSFDEGMAVTLENVAALPKSLQSQWITVATAGAVEGLENLAANVTGGVSGFTPKFAFRDGKLMIRLRSVGMSVIVR